MCLFLLVKLLNGIHVIAVFLYQNLEVNQRPLNLVPQLLSKKISKYAPGLEYYEGFDLRFWYVPTQ